MITQTLLLNHIIQGDCREVLKTFPDNYIDLIVTSPPYWDIVDYQTKDIDDIGRKQSLSNYLSQMKEVFSECKRVLKYGRYFHVIIRDVTKNRQTYLLHAKLADVAEEAGLHLEDLKYILLLSHAHYDFDVILRKGTVLQNITIKNSVMTDKYDEPFWDLRKFNRKKNVHPAQFISKIPEIIIKKME